jgi:hypothetical protein
MATSATKTKYAVFCIAEMALLPTKSFAALDFS